MPANMPAFACYGPYSGSYGMHSLCFTTPKGDRFWYSYQTLVAFYHPIRGRVVHRNDWGPTTGKHLNAIDGGDRKNRVSAEEFKRLFQEAYGALES